MRLLYPLLAMLALYTVGFLVRAWWRAPHPIAAIGCFFRGRHLPQRHPVGGYTCSACAHAGAHLGEMGFPDGGYIKSLRPVYTRGRDGSLTRTTAWAPGPRGW
jgi:hypothetical protein